MEHKVSEASNGSRVRIPLEPSCPHTCEDHFSLLYELSAAKDNKLQEESFQTCLRIVRDNLDSRVSLLCLPFLDDKGGREERPWKRGCLRDSRPTMASAGYCELLQYKVHLSYHQHSSSGTPDKDTANIRYLHSRIR